MNCSSSVPARMDLRIGGFRSGSNRFQNWLGCLLRQWINFNIWVFNQVQPEGSALISLVGFASIFRRRVLHSTTSASVDVRIAVVHSQSNIRCTREHSELHFLIFTRISISLYGQTAPKWITQPPQSLSRTHCLWIFLLMSGTCTI